jgi:hypothetical protein
LAKAGGVRRAVARTAVVVAEILKIGEPFGGVVAAQPGRARGVPFVRETLAPVGGNISFGSLRPELDLPDRKSTVADAAKLTHSSL